VIALVSSGAGETKDVSRIVVLSPFEPPPDGIARHTAHLVDAWDADGHQVLVISPGRQGGLDAAVRIGSKARVARVLRWRPRRRLWDEVAAFRPDVVIVQFAIAAVNTSFWSVANLCRRCAVAGIPVVVTYHEPAREFGLLKFVTPFLYRAMARVTTVPVVFSQAGGDALVEHGLFAQVIQLPHGTAGVTAIADADVERIRSRYDIRKPLVLTLGFTGFDKGTDVLLEAASLIAARGRSDIQYLIAGAPRRRRGIFRLREFQDVAFQRRLERRGSEISGADLAFTGFVPDSDVAALLLTADVVVLPYRRITQSGVANLALSSRSVIVCSDLPGLRSDLGDAAIYLAVGDSDALANGVESLLGAENSSRRERMRDLSGERATVGTFARVAEELLVAGLASGESRN
jgi:glycosyltransferase involved in cell wall biosynthesis